MKRKVFAIALATVMMVTLLVAPVAVIAHTEASPLVIRLMADQDIDVGYVSVWNDADVLHVEYTTIDGWELTQTHLDVAVDPLAIPQTKKGNPKPGQFASKMKHDPTVQTYLYDIPITWDVGDPLYIAAHAKVIDTNNMMTVTAVSDTSVSVYGPLGSYAPLDDTAWGSSGSAVSTWAHPSWPSISGADWISTAYYAEDTNDSWRLFHDEITIPGYPSGGTVFVTADNAEEVYFNGALVDSDGEVQGPFVDNQEWSTILGYSISPQSGLNTLDFIVRNYAMAGGSATSNPAGLIYEAEISYYPEETAWGDGTGFAGKNWATYFEYTVQ